MLEKKQPTRWGKKKEFYFDSIVIDSYGNFNLTIMRFNIDKKSLNNRNIYTIKHPEPLFLSNIISDYISVQLINSF